MKKHEPNAMKITSRDKEPKSAIPGLAGVTIQNVISEADEASNFHMRIFEPVDRADD